MSGAGGQYRGTREQLQTGGGGRFLSPLEFVMQRLRGSSFTRVLSIPTCGAGIVAPLRFFSNHACHPMEYPTKTRPQMVSSIFNPYTFLIECKGIPLKTATSNLWAKRIQTV